MGKDENFYEPCMTLSTLVFFIATIIKDTIIIKTILLVDKKPFEKLPKYRIFYSLQVQQKSDDECGITFYIVSRTTEDLYHHNTSFGFRVLVFAYFLFIYT